MEDYRLINLKNGLRAILVRTPEFHSINGQITVKAGPGIEEKKNNGISHFVEHMVFQGTELFPDKDKFDEEIEYLGGGYNGSTSYSKVNLRLEVPDTHLALAVEYLYQLAYKALFPATPLETERSAILDEIHSFNSDPFRKFSKFWNNTRYAKGFRPYNVVGTQSGIRKMKRTDLINWYKYIFSPSNVTLSLVGNFDLDDAERLVHEFFGGVKNETKQEIVNTYREIRYSKRTIKTQVDTDEKQAIGGISFPGLSLFKNEDRERYASIILESVLANLRSSILFKKLRKDTGMIYNVYIDNSFGVHEPGTFEISFLASDNKVVEVYRVILDELKRLKTEGFSKELLKLGVESGNNALRMGYASVGQIISWYTPSVFWFNQVRTLEEAIAKRNSVDLDYLNEIFNKVVDWDNVNVISRVNSAKTKKSVEEMLRAELG